MDMCVHMRVCMCVSGLLRLGVGEWKLSKRRKGICVMLAMLENSGERCVWNGFSQVSTPVKMEGNQ